MMRDITVSHRFNLTSCSSTYLFHLAVQLGQKILMVQVLLQDLPGPIIPCHLVDPLDQENREILVDQNFRKLPVVHLDPADLHHENNENKIMMTMMMMIIIIQSFIVIIFLTIYIYIYIFPKCACIRVCSLQSAKWMSGPIWTELGTCIELVFKCLNQIKVKVRRRTPKT